jgi:hypothetical protein
MNKLMDVFLTKLPQTLSFGRAEFYRQQAWLPATRSVVPHPALTDSQPIRHIAYVEQTSELGGKWALIDNGRGTCIRHMLKLRCGLSSIHTGNPF